MASCGQRRCRRWPLAAPLWLLLLLAALLAEGPGLVKAVHLVNVAENTTENATANATENLTVDEVHSQIGDLISDLSKEEMMKLLKYSTEYARNVTGNRSRSDGSVRPPADLASIAERFGEMEAKVGELRSRVGSLEQAVLDVESVANLTGAGVAQSEQDLANVSTLARSNSVAAAALRAQFLTAAERVKNATSQIKGLEGEVLSVQQSAMEATSSSAELGNKVGELEAIMTEVLPGRDAIPSRIDQAQATLQDYFTQAQAGILDPILVSKLRASFLRATRRTEALAESALQARLTASD